MRREEEVKEGEWMGDDGKEGMLEKGWEERGKEKGDEGKDRGKRKGGRRAVRRMRGCEEKVGS